MLDEAIWEHGFVLDKEAARAEAENVFELLLGRSGRHAASLEIMRLFAESGSAEYAQIIASAAATKFTNWAITTADIPEMWAAGRTFAHFLTTARSIQLAPEPTERTES